MMGISVILKILFPHQHSKFKSVRNLCVVLADQMVKLSEFRSIWSWRPRLQSRNGPVWPHRISLGYHTTMIPSSVLSLNMNSPPRYKQLPTIREDEQTTTSQGCNARKRKKN